MTALVIYNCNQLSQYLKQALEKGSGKEWKLGNNEWSPRGAHGCMHCKNGRVESTCGSTPSVCWFTECML